MNWLLLIGAAAGAQAATPAKVNHFVEVNGVRYRVEVKGDVVTVAKKKMFVKWNMAERDAQREAVRKATGCEVVDEFPSTTKLKGRLSCPPSSAATAN